MQRILHRRQTVDVLLDFAKCCRPFSVDFYFSCTFVIQLAYEGFSISDCAIVRWVGGLVSPMDVNKLDVWLSNAFQALPFPIPQNWLVVSHPVIA